MKNSYEHLIIIVRRVKQGEAILRLSREYHINEPKIPVWVRMWDKYGRMGLEKQPQRRPTPAQKEKSVRLILEVGVPLAHIRIEYRIGKTALQCWISQVRKYGYEILHLKKKRGRTPKYKMQNLRRKNHRQNWRNFRRRNFA